jgi:transcriptional regulator GlxA family with amidase domain
MEKNEQQELEELRNEVKRLREMNTNLVMATEQLIERNVDLYERLDVYYHIRIHADWLMDMVRKHREVVAHADLRDDKELLAIIEARLEGENIPLPPEFGLAELSELVGVTQSRLKDLFKRKTIHHTVDKYLDYLRLLRALRLLKEHPDYSIEAIAHEAGFGTVRTLNRKIQDTIGMPAGVYRDISNPHDD